MTKAKKQEEIRFFILTVKTEKADELKKELMSYGHNFEKLKTSQNFITGYTFFKVNFKNSSERNALCDFCDYLNGFRDSPA